MKIKSLNLWTISRNMKPKCRLFFSLQHSGSLIWDKFWCLFLFKELDFKNSHQCHTTFLFKTSKHPEYGQLQRQKGHALIIYLHSFCEWVVCRCIHTEQYTPMENLLSSHISSNRRISVSPGCTGLPLRQLSIMVNFHFCTLVHTGNQCKIAFVLSIHKVYFLLQLCPKLSCRFLSMIACFLRFSNFELHDLLNLMIFFPCKIQILSRFFKMRLGDGCDTVRTQPYFIFRLWQKLDSIVYNPSIFYNMPKDVLAKKSFKKAPKNSPPGNSCSKSCTLPFL